jgi:zinc transporter ZupT
MRDLFQLIRRGYELAGAIVLTVQVSGSALVGVVVAYILNLPSFLAFLLALVVFAGAMGVALIWNGQRQIQEEQAEPRRKRVGIQNRDGGRSVSTGATFGPGLDTAIDNIEGGESEDRDSTFL